MSCCERCADGHHRTYDITGDGDGIEFMTEVDHGPDGDRVTATVVYCAPGIGEPAGVRRGGIDPAPPAPDR